MLKRFRVIHDHAVNGLARGEEFEAEWPNNWLSRRVRSGHIEEVLPVEEAAEELEENPSEEEEA